MDSDWKILENRQPSCGVSLPSKNWRMERFTLHSHSTHQWGLCRRQQGIEECGCGAEKHCQLLALTAAVTPKVLSLLELINTSRGALYIATDLANRFFFLNNHTC